MQPGLRTAGPQDRVHGRPTMIDLVLLTSQPPFLALLVSTLRSSNTNSNFFLWVLLTLSPLFGDAHI